MKACMWAAKIRNLKSNRKGFNELHLKFFKRKKKPSLKIIGKTCGKNFAATNLPYYS